MSALLRFEPKYTVNPVSGCWDWIAVRHRLGYGQFKDEGKMWQAHRWAYRHYVGSLEEGKEIDHICRNRRCVNPAHLRQISHRDNVLASPTCLASINKARVECARGHSFSKENTSYRGNKRVCVQCRRRNAREYMRRRRKEVP